MRRTLSQMWVQCVSRMVLAVVLISALPASAQTQATTKDAPAGKTELVAVRLRSAHAPTAAKVLMQLLDGSNLPKDQGKPSVVVDDRTNIVIISGTAEQILVAKQFLMELDSSTQAVDRNAAIEKRLDQLEKTLQTLLADLKTVREQLKPATQPDNKGNPGTTSR